MGDVAENEVPHVPDSGFLELRNKKKLRRKGLFIASERIEAAARVLVARWCKQAGMHWRHQNAVRISAIHAQLRSAA
jgi:hypothetical protein